mgnify:CR=1 FL=1
MGFCKEDPPVSFLWGFCGMKIASLIAHHKLPVTSSYEMIWRFVPQYPARVIVQPVFNALDIFVCQLSYIEPLGDKSAYQFVLVFVAPAFPAAVRMSIVAGSPLYSCLKAGAFEALHI